MPATTDPPEASFKSFAGVPGLDTDLGLRSVRGRSKSYLRLLRMFLDTHADDLPAMRRLLVAGELHEVQRLAHSLKGTAATLGATRLQALAARLEAGVRDRLGGALIELNVAVLETEWQQFAPPLAAALVKVETPQPAGNAQPVIDVAVVRVTLDRIEALLAVDDMAVNGEFRTAADSLYAYFGSDLKQFEARLQAFDYVAALEWLRARRTTGKP